MDRGFSHESSKNKTVEWYTPKHIFDAIGLTFDLDPCSPGKDIVPWIPAKECYTVEQDGLMLPWNGNVWMNPPYGYETPIWLGLLASHGLGMALLFSRTDSKWFHKYAVMADAICFIKGRIQFINEKNAKAYADDQYESALAGSPGAGSMLIAFGEDNAKALFNSGLGLTMKIGK